MKPGQLVKYYPAVNDPAVADRNSAKFFPAIVTQTFDDSTRLNLIVFVWNGISPVHSIETVPEGLNVDEPHDHAYYGPLTDGDSMIDDDGDINVKLITVQDSIAETQEMLNRHAETYAEANKAIGEAMNQNVIELEKKVESIGAAFHQEFNSEVARIDNALTEFDKRIKAIEKKK